MPLNGLLMIAMPIALAIFLQRRLGVRGSLFGAGALTFIASQVLHIPFLSLLTALFAQHVLPAPPSEWALPFNAVVLGLAAGLFEEVARWIAYRYFLRTARTWKEALMFGAGHGGIEAILLGMVVLVTFAAMYTFQTTPGLIPAGQSAQIQAQLGPYWSQLPLAVFVGAYERVTTLCTHVAMAVLVLQAFTRRNILYLVAAILWHAAVDAIAVYAAPTWGIAVTEAILTVWGVAALLLIVAMRPRAPEPIQPAPALAT